jgi:hypothetical protein
MFLIDTFHDACNKKIKCEIINYPYNERYSIDKGLDYTNIIKINYSNCKKITVKCNCADFKQSNTFLFFFKRPRYCEHVSWFGLCYLNNMYVSFWSLQSIQIFIYQYIPELVVSNLVTNGNNNDSTDSADSVKALDCVDCVICLDKITHENQITYNCNICKNIVHAKCWNLYLISVNRLRSRFHLKKCCVCRSGYLPCLLK